MKKLVLCVGMAVGFVAGSWAGRAPFERLEAALRNVTKQPKVQSSLQSAAESAGAVRDATLDAAAGAFGQAADAATEAFDGAAKKVVNRTERVASTARDG